MSYSELVELYFERSVALQWYWTVYVLVIGGVLGFSAVRQRPDLVTTLLVALLFAGFAYKNGGAIVAAAQEREAIRVAIKEYPASGANAAHIEQVRGRLEPIMPEYDIAGARNFHIGCDVLTIAFLAAAEWRRRKAAGRL